MSCFLDSPGLAMDALPAGVRRRVYEKSIQLRHTDVYSTVRASIMDILTRDIDALEALEYDVVFHRDDVASVTCSREMYFNSSTRVLCVTVCDEMYSVYAFPSTNVVAYSRAGKYKDVMLECVKRDADARERLIVIIENEYEVLHHHHTIVRSVTL